eukprot:1826395-Pyramimonas_sp.AAC.1
MARLEQNGVQHERENADGVRSHCPIVGWQDALTPNVVRLMRWLSSHLAWKSAAVMSSEQVSLVVMSERQNRASATIQTFA